MPESPIWLSEAEVISLIDLGEAITAVRDGLGDAAAGRAVSMQKTQAQFEGGTMHATGAASSTTGYACSKTWAHTKSGATPLVLLWSLGDGRLCAVLEAFAIGQYRTAAITAVATDLLAAQTARELAICGTGAQALMQVAAINAVRDIRTVRVWSPRAESRQRFGNRVGEALGLETADAATAGDAVAGADVITLITRSTTPFLRSSDVPAGAHVNAIGAISADRAEFAPELLGRCGVIAVDDITAAQAWSAEFRAYFGPEPGNWLQVASLAELAAEPDGRPPGADVTLFKAMGMGLGDLSIAAFVYDRARTNGLGEPLPVPARSRPRLRSSLKGSTKQ